MLDTKEETIKELENIIFSLVDTYVTADDWLYEDRIKRSIDYCKRVYNIDIKHPRKGE